MVSDWSVEGRGSIPRPVRLLHVIYAAHLPGEVHPASKAQHPVQQAVCADIFDYGDGLRALWGHGDTIINVEHDMEYSDALVRQLLECMHPLCAHAYRMHNAPRPYYAHGWLPRNPAMRVAAEGIRWIDQYEEWADYSALGFVKITPDARRHPLAENIPWMALECEVNAAVAGERWHIHWPEIEHYHHSYQEDQ